MQDSLSIAVLPFKNLSSNQENEYFCDGITEEIINALAKIGQLKVTSRTSSFFFKDKDLPVADIAERLGVTVLLEGSVRRSGNVIRITAQLIQAEGDFHFWSETWDRELDNIFDIQDEISLLIADRIREHFGHFELDDHLVRKQTDDINAYEYSLIARYHKNKWNTEDAGLAEEYYQKAIDLDETHVESIIGLSDVYSFMAMTGSMSFVEAWEKSNGLMQQAFELDPNNPEIYYQKANNSFFTECNYATSMEYCRKSIQLKPNYVEAQQFMSFLHILAGNYAQAKEHLDIALGIDPLSQETLFYSAYYDYMTENFDSAISKLNECLVENPKNLPAHAVICLCLVMTNEPDRAIHYYDDLSIDVIAGERLGAVGLAYAKKGDAEKTEEYFEILSEMAKTPDGFAADSFVFMMYVVSGQIEQAFQWIDDGIKTKAALLLLRYADPIINPLKSDPRYAEYHEKLFFVPKQEVHVKRKNILMDDQKSEAFKQHLLEHFKEKQPYLDPELTLRSLADQIEMHPNQLSWLLNENIGKSFNSFVNSYRIEAFKKMARDPKNSHLTLLGMAYESGFNSKTVFNTYFKKETGLTPKQFVKG